MCVVCVRVCVCVCVCVCVRVFHTPLFSTQEEILEMIRRFCEPFIGILFYMLTLLFGSRSLQRYYGKDYMLRSWQQYLGGICSNSKSMKAFLRGFQDLDAHSTGHLLDQISHPTLLIAGIWDFLTPPHTMMLGSQPYPQTCRRLLFSGVGFKRRRKRMNFKGPNQGW